MADKKISQLTAASTPLAGTEVLPIVQSGSTVKVSSDDLTVKNVRSNATSGLLQVAGPAAGTTRVMTTPDANFTVARTDAAQTFTGNQVFGAVDIATNLEFKPTSGTFGAAPSITSFSNGYLYILGGTGGLILRDDGGAVGIQIQNDDYIKFETGNPAAEAARFNAAGNLAFAVGKGIADANGNESMLFTATASAVNELTVANAATGSSPIIAASGGDTNVGITLTPKGTGNVSVTNGAIIVGSAATAGGLFRTDGFQKVFTATTADIFSLRFDAEGAAFVDIAVAGVIAATGGQRQIVRLAVDQVNGGTATVTSISSTGQSLITTSVTDSGDTSTVTFKVAGSATNQATYQINVVINGVSALGTGGYDAVVYTRL